jgi:ABC-type amino acid transport system permease subunit
VIREFTVNELWLLILAARWTVLLSAIAFVGGGAGGFVLAIARVSSRNRSHHWPPASSRSCRARRC